MHSAKQKEKTMTIDEAIIQTIEATQRIEMLNYVNTYGKTRKELIELETAIQLEWTHFYEAKNFLNSLKK